MESADRKFRVIVWELVELCPHGSSVSYAHRKFHVIRLTTIDRFSELNDAWVKLRAAHEVMQARQAAAFQAMSANAAAAARAAACVQPPCLLTS